MLNKKSALLAGILALAVAGTSYQVFAGPDGGDKNGGGDHGGGGDGKNGGGDGGKNGGGDGGKNGGGHSSKNGDDGRNDDRCFGNRFQLKRHGCKRYVEVRRRMKACASGGEVVYAYDCRFVWVPAEEQVDYDAPVRKKTKWRARKARAERVIYEPAPRKHRRKRVADAGYGYDDYAGGEVTYAVKASRAARMQQKRRAQQGHCWNLGADYAYHGCKKKRRAMYVPAGYDSGTVIHYGPAVQKNGSW